jgi:uncharacterized protein (DUF433 family)
MATMASGVKHPYIVSRKDVCGGSPAIAGARFPVRSVVGYVLLQGMTPEELVAEFGHISLAQVYDALSYYYDHREEIDIDLASNSEEASRSVPE